MSLPLEADTNRIALPRFEAELVPITQLLTLAADQMNRGLQDRDRLESAAITATNLLGELKLLDLEANIDAAEVWDTAFVSLAIADRWNHPIGYCERLQLTNALLRLYPPGRVRREPDSIGEPFSIQTNQLEVLNEITRRVWPTETQNLEGSDALFAFLSTKSNDHIVRLPYYMQPAEGQPSAKNFFEEVLVHCGFKKEEVHLYEFSGMAYHAQQLIFLWEDSSDRTLLHECIHLTSPGVRVGWLGDMLNEGITDLRTTIVLNQQRGKSNLMLEDINELASYVQEVFLVAQLMDLHTIVASSLINHYDNHTVATAWRFVDACMKTIGLDLYRRLYMAIPGEYESYVFPELMPSNVHFEEF